MQGGGGGLSQHGRETQDREVQRWVYELEGQMEQKQVFNEGDMAYMGQGDRRTKGYGRGKSRGHKHGGGSLKKVGEGCSNLSI